MRLSMTVNGAAPIVASVNGSGYLSAALKMMDRPDEYETRTRITVGGFETQTTETARLEWPTIDLKIGDVVELRILPNGQGDPPSEIRRSSEAPYNLFANTELAKELLQAVSQFEQRLDELRNKSQAMEPADEHRRFAAATGMVAWELGRNFLNPVYRRHKELIPEKMKGEIL